MNLNFARVELVLVLREGFEALVLRFRKRSPVSLRMDLTPREDEEGLVTAYLITVSRTGEVKGLQQRAPVGFPPVETYVKWLREELAAHPRLAYNVLWSRFAVAHPKLRVYASTSKWDR